MSKHLDSKRIKKVQIINISFLGVPSLVGGGPTSTLYPNGGTGSQPTAGLQYPSNLPGGAGYPSTQLPGRGGLVPSQTGSGGQQLGYPGSAVPSGPAPLQVVGVPGSITGRRPTDGTIPSGTHTYPGPYQGSAQPGRLLRKKTVNINFQNKVDWKLDIFWLKSSHQKFI